MNTGFIGYGSMGSMIVKGMLETRCLEPENVVISTRHPASLSTLLEKYPLVNVAENNRSLVKKCNRVFLCTRPLDTVTILSEIAPDLNPDSHLISIVSCLPFQQIARFFPGAITRVVPSLTAEMNSGVSLLCHNPAVTREVSKDIEEMFRTLGKVVLIDEENFEAGSDLTSCGPALIAVLMDEFARAAAKASTLTIEQARELATSTLSGTARLLDERDYSLDMIMKRVATPGGITQEGAHLLQSEMPPVFDALIQRTLAKHELVKTNVRKEADRMLNQKS